MGGHPVYTRRYVLTHERKVYKHEAKLSVSDIIYVSKHFLCLKLNRRQLKSLSIVFRTWFSTAWSIEF